MKNIYCVVGPSGSGKTTLTLELCRRHPDWHAIESFTDRAPRYEGERGHIFLSKDEFTHLMNERPVVAYTEYAGNRYGVTAKEIDENDLYVVDIRGIETMRRVYNGIKGLKVIGLKPDHQTIIERMTNRGDSPDAILTRLQTDDVAFADLEKAADVTIEISPSMSVSYLAGVAEEIIRDFEASTPTVKIYQINTDYDMARVAFAGRDVLAQMQRKEHPEINLSVYDMVWEGDLGNVSLDEIFAIFNSDKRPNAKTSRSLSVSDVVEILHNPDPERNGLWFCDTFGWRRIHNNCCLE